MLTEAIAAASSVFLYSLPRLSRREYAAPAFPAFTLAGRFWTAKNSLLSRPPPAPQSPVLHRSRLSLVVGAADSTQPASASAQKTIVSDNDFSLAKAKFTSFFGPGITAEVGKGRMMIYMKSALFLKQVHNQQRGQVKEQAFVRKVRESSVKEAKHRIPVAQALPLTTDKPQNLAKPPVKEQTKPLNFKLHTQERAARRAGFNDLVANKIYSLELLRRFEEKIEKVIEEEEIKNLRKEMVPKAQLMPFFDRPFLPQRSTRPLTVPKEPSFLQRKSCGGDEPYKYYQQFLGQHTKAIR